MFAAVANDACFNTRGRQLSCDGIGRNSCTNAQRQECCVWRNGSCRYRSGGGGGGGGNHRCDSNFASRSQDNCENRTSGPRCTWVRRGNNRNSFCEFRNRYYDESADFYSAEDEYDFDESADYSSEDEYDME